MAVSREDAERIESFRRRFAEALTRFEGIGPEAREDRPDGTVLSSRFPVGASLWIDACVRPTLPQLRAGIMTDSRWVSEDLEQAIEDSGDTMSEFVELGFDEAGLDWREPTVEHYRDQGKYFYFATALDLDNLAALDAPETLDKLLRMCQGYYEAFKPAIGKLAASE